MNYEYKKMSPSQAIEFTMRVNKEGKIIAYFDYYMMFMYVTLRKITKFINFYA